MKGATKMSMKKVTPVVKKKSASKPKVSAADQVQKFSSQPDEVREMKEKALRNFLKAEGFARIGAGCTRVTYGSPECDYVIKMGSSYINLREVQFAKRPKNGIKVAKCSLQFMKGVPVVKMEKVKVLITPQTYGSEASEKIIRKLRPKHPWIALIDCNQIGKTKDGRIVAFDVGNM
jgi:hypothetical protein